MSSKFAIVHPEYKGSMDDVTEEDYTIIGSSNMVIEELEPLILRLPKDTPIICIDNSTDFKTIGDYLQYLKL